MRVRTPVRTPYENNIKRYALDNGILYSFLFGTKTSVFYLNNQRWRRHHEPSRAIAKSRAIGYLSGSSTQTYIGMEKIYVVGSSPKKSSSLKSVRRARLREII